MDAIGHTPAVRLARLFAERPEVEVIAKLEYMNPSGSIKDRMVRYMLKHAQENHQLDAKHVVESSSGNTGAALAMACAVHKLKCEISVPDRTSVEKIKRISAYGAKVHPCPSDVPGDHPDSYYSRAHAIAEESDAFHLDQYRSALNREAHYFDTAPELWEQLAGRLDYFVCGIGSGGTISGIGKYLKERNPNIRVIGVEPNGSIYRSAVGCGVSNAGFRTVIEGVGKQKPSESFDPTVIDDVIQVPDTLSLEYCHRLACEEGILVGGSSGSVAAGVAKLLEQVDGGRVVTIFPDSGAFYLSKYF
ncbi:MAG TPA: cysteine synthase family protein [Paucimonas sp.]|nr:cysteine synthase family protein [Paucimonas sp.]